MVTKIIDRFQSVFLRVISILSVFYLCFYYRQGGVKDAGIANPSLRDVGVYIDAGKAVLLGLNPYETVGNRFGTLGPLPIALLSYLVPSEFLTFFFQAINLAGIYFFLFVFARRYGKGLVDPIFLTIIFFASTREMLTTNQITGILMGLIAFGYLFYLRFLEGKSLWTLLVSGFCFALAADLKPHLVAFFILYLCFCNRQISPLVSSFVIWVIGHLLIDLSQGRILEIDWIRSLQDLQMQSSKGMLGDSVSFWPLIYKLIGVNGLPTSVTILPLILALLFGVKYSLKNDLAKIGPWIFLMPSLSIYFHYYDAIPAFLLALVVIKNQINLRVLVFIGFVLIPKEFQSIENQILVLAFLFLWAYISSNNVKISKVGLAYILINSIHLINDQITDDAYLMQSLVVSESLILCVSSIIVLNKNSGRLKKIQYLFGDSRTVT